MYERRTASQAPLRGSDPRIIYARKVGPQWAAGCVSMPAGPADTGRQKNPIGKPPASTFDIDDDDDDDDDSHSTPPTHPTASPPTDPS